jgi:hypothetical protein
VRDPQAQTCPAILILNRFICLGERSEQFLDVLLADTYSAIYHFYHKGSLLFLFHFFEVRKYISYLAFLRGPLFLRGFILFFRRNRILLLAPFLILSYFPIDPYILLVINLGRLLLLFDCWMVSSFIFMLCILRSSY